MIHIPIKSGPIDLKIRGVEGGTIQEVLDEARQGARFILYQYAVSFVAFSLQRPSDVFCLRPGSSRLVPGLRYSLLSMLVGWWSLPAGIVFTIQALTRNFRGGLDVTDQVVAVLSNAPAGSAPRLLLKDSTLILAPPAQPVVFDPTLAAAKTARRRRDRNFFLLVGAIVAALVAGGVAHRATHYPLALVNGTKSPYTVVVDGKSFPLVPGRAQVLAVTVGKHIASATLSDGAAPVREFEVGADWYDPFTPRSSTIVNLDRLALIVDRHQVYGKSTSPAVVPKPRVWATHDVLTTQLPYFFFEKFPSSVEEPGGSKDIIRNQITTLPSMPVEENIRLLAAYGAEEDLRDYRALIAAKQATDNASTAR